MEEEKQIEWKNDEVYLYNGKTLKLARDDWKIFTLMFDVGGNFPFKISAWSSLGDKEGKKGTSLTIKDLEEGEYYKVSYKVEKEAFEAHGKKHDNRTVYHIEVSNEEECKAFKAEQAQSRVAGTTNSQDVSTSKETNQPTNVPAATILTPSDIERFINGYAEKINWEQPNYYEATLSFLLNHYGPEGFGATIASAYNLIKSQIEKYNNDTGLEEDLGAEPEQPTSSVPEVSESFVSEE